MTRKVSLHSPVSFLLDTCVWLDLARNYEDRPLLYALEQLVDTGLVDLLIPQVVIDEFKRNKSLIVDESIKSTSQALRRARDATYKFGSKRKRSSIANELDEISRKLVNFGDEVSDLIGRVEVLLGRSAPIQITDTMKMNAAERAIAKAAPFHKNRNSFGDALIFEVFVEKQSGARAGARFAFVTHNVKDFSAPGGDIRIPHPDLAVAFTGRKSRYFSKLVDALQLYWPGDFDGLVAESSYDDRPPRRIKELLSAEEELTLKRWYDRHQMRVDAVRSGRIRIVSVEDYKYEAGVSDKIRSDIWEGALEAAKKVEERFGKDNLGPYSDFEWGMLAGKLSAVRWVLGDDWDNLDT